ncbi:biotin--[acetyl-CoA-carboxylase] ligase [Achromobacter deleyi]|uniref:biotin--[acetyl-CoA-carboxylase] ligase n=1 Tax=Achromobacter deleyi TaxID=1353891 RepID=UPI001490F154|nr:biotin--[acetyl-CoA-carboxylase] ligase [Achromobacter deleyi]QVQ25602.1 biotin--[acetyl-CoA-carboxylase] ligase [Achromobacter deleyi]UIP21142.1 biotin--[acetyl-CoA-carboxylase] ligase [Achromobacter deleyi]
MPAQVCPIDLPAPETLARTLGTRLPAFQDIAWTGSTGSTNADLLARARSGASAGKPWLLGTHLQETGRGRAGRPWQNRVGSTLMFSCAFDVHLPATQLPALSPLAGVAACEALRAVAGRDARGLCMKWPNDVQWQDAKLAGVLVETTRNPGGREAGYTVVIGMGVNLSGAAELSLALGREVADWTQVQAHSAHAALAADLVCASATAWHEAVQALERDGFGAFRQRFDQVDALAGRKVNVLDKGAILLSGTACGVDEQGRLLVQTPQGATPISVGEISIRRQA